VRGIDVLLEVRDANRRAAEAGSPAISDLGRQLEAGFRHGFLPGVERAVAPVFVKIGLSAFGEKIAPCDLESTTAWSKVLALPLACSAGFPG